MLYIMHHWYVFRYSTSHNMVRIFCKITQFLSYKQFIWLKFQKRVKKFGCLAKKDYLCGWKVCPETEMKSDIGYIWWISVVTSKEMVADPPHSACRCWLQTTLCCSDGNRWVVNDNWKPSVRLVRYVSRRWTQVNHWWSIVSKVSKSHQNQGLFFILG